MEFARIFGSRTVLAHAVSGAVASCAAMSVTYPLEKARVKLISDPSESSVFVVLKKVVEQEGLLGLFTGLQPMLISLGTSNFVFFYWHTVLKGLIKQSRHPQDRHLELGVLTSLVIAFISGCLNVVMTSPLWVAFARMTSSKKADIYKKLSVFQVLSKITKEEGLVSLWSGLIPSLVLVSNPTIQFVSFEKIKALIFSWFHGYSEVDDQDAVFEDLKEVKVDENAAIEFIKQINPELTSLEAFVAGGVSKLIATVLTYPVQVAQTELRSGNKYKGTFDCLKTIYKERGLQNGLFKGFTAKILQTVLNSAASKC